VWNSLPKDGYDSVSAFAFDAKGSLWLGSSSNGVSVFNGNIWAIYSQKSKDLSSNQISDIVADTLGRVWLSTPYGLSIFDGTTWQTYRMDNSEIGDNNIRFAVVTKDGPALPELVEKDKGSLAGVLHDADDNPLAKMRVEICVETIGFQVVGDSPCADQAFFLSTQTDEQGAFSIENIPVGYYLIVSETHTGWAELTTKFGIGSERILISAGEKADVGILKLKKKQ
jgi:hypothetical protein